jgi:hypothetical protein
MSRQTELRTATITTVRKDAGKSGIFLESARAYILDFDGTYEICTTKGSFGVYKLIKTHHVCFRP